MNKKSSAYADQVARKAARKRHALRHPAPGVWFGFGMMGLIGWAIVVPTLLGAALGLWLDSHYPIQHSWTLALLTAGLFIGCWNAWRWLLKEDAAIHAERDDTDG